MTTDKIWDDLNLLHLMWLISNLSAVQGYIAAVSHIMISVTKLDPVYDSTTAGMTVNQFHGASLFLCNNPAWFSTLVADIDWTFAKNCGVCEYFWVSAIE